MLVARGHGIRTAPVALARCRAPSLNRSSSAPKSLCAARRRHMTPHRVLVVQSRRPLRMAMGHTSGALRSRNSASSAPGPASGRKKRLDGGWRGCDLEKRLGKDNRTSQAVLGGQAQPVNLVQFHSTKCESQQAFIIPPQTPQVRRTSSVPGLSYLNAFHLRNAFHGLLNTGSSTDVSSARSICLECRVCSGVCVGRGVSFQT